MVLLITFFAVSAPYLVFLKSVTGSFQLSGRAGITLIGGEHLTNKGHWLHYEKELYSLNAEGKQVFMYAGKPISMLKYTIDNFPSMIKRFFINLWSYTLSLFNTLFPVGLLLVAAYIFLRKPKYANIKEIWFLLIMMLPVFASMLFFLYDRYIFPYLPIIYLFCVFGLIKLGEVVKEKFNLKPSAVIIFQVILILLFQMSVFEPYLHPPETARCR